MVAVILSECRYMQWSHRNNRLEYVRCQRLNQSMLQLSVRRWASCLDMAELFERRRDWAAF